MSKEYELWDTYDQVRINTYKTQGAAMRALYDCYRYGCDPDRLDLVMQRPNDKQIHLCSGRDEGIREWFDAIDELTVALRLTFDVDIIENDEWLEYRGYTVLTEDRGPTNTQINMERYAAVIDNVTGIGGGVGAADFEAIGRALIDMREATV